MKKWGTLFVFQLLFSGMLACSGSQPSNTQATPPEAKENPPSQSENIKWISFGDWGTGDANQMAVANQAQQTCQSAGCDFGLLLGDNFYTTGVSSTADAQWKNKYRDVYSKLNLSFYASLGNHDWDSPANPQAQIDYSALDSTWKMPASYYTQSFQSSTETLLQIFVINSNDFKTNSQEQTWLSTQLAQSTAKWKILVFHHPIYSNSASHPADEKGIYPTLKPIICGKIDLLLSGHDHLFSHLRNTSENCGYDQVIIGTGGRHLYSNSGNSGQASLLYTESNYGLGHFSLNTNEMTLHFIRSDGQTGYSYSWQKAN